MSKLEVNTIEPQCGTTLTLGGSGDTVTLASGASQSGFGRTGAVDWQTTAKTATFTAANGEGYFINSGSAITANLPAGSAGAIVAFSDYARNFATYNFTVSPNGSEKIGGIAGDLTANVNGQALTLVYVDSTKGWVNVQNAQDTQAASTYITATGGTITCSGNYKIHTFTSPGTFCVSAAAGPLAVADYMVVAGGGGGTAGGGGAGGFRESHCATTSGPYTASPLASSTSLPISVQGYPITVGAGGSAGSYPGTGKGNGADSVFSTITSTGGGAAGNSPTPSPGGDGADGGSGGAAGQTPSGSAAVGSGNTPSVSPPQGSDGGTSSPAPVNAVGMGGGGGATAVGGNGTSGPAPTKGNAGSGGAGATTSISATPTAYGGGGGGGAQGATPQHTGDANNGGSGGGGSGGVDSTLTDGDGTANTGGGGGGNYGGPCATAGAGGSGIVIIRYKYQ
jgi:hypothetical protein